MSDGAPIMKRSVAKSLGVVRYRTGKPCPAGHLADRYVSTGQCSACTQASTREWQAVEENRERNREYARASYWRNPALRNLQRREWDAKNPERRKELARLWRERNPDGGRRHMANRRARLANAPGRHTAEEIAALMEAQRLRCAYCRKSIKEEFHVDHIFPISKGGSNDIRNIQLTCVACNQHKHAKDPFQFAREIGRLL